MEKILTAAMEQGGILGLVAAGCVIVLVLGIVLVMKMMGVTAITDKKAIVDTKQVDGVAETIGQIRDAMIEQMTKVEGRISTVEREIERRATRDEVHHLELAFTRMEGRFESIDQRTSATAHAVGRIESFMYEAAMRSRGKE